MGRGLLYIIVLLAIYILEGMDMIKNKKKKEMLAYSFITIVAMLLGFYYIMKPFEYSFSDSVMSILRITH